MAVLVLIKKFRPKILLLLIGPMKDDPKILDKIIQELQLDENVVLLAKMPYEEMQAYLVNTRVGLVLYQRKRIYPWFGAGNGRKIVTYMQAGIPIVGPEFGCIGKSISLAQCGVLVNTEDPVAVANAVITLLEHSNMSRRLGMAGKKKVKNEWNWDLESKKLLYFLENLGALPSTPIQLFGNVI